MLYLLDLICVAIFAFAGAMQAKTLHKTVFAVLFVALLTAIGGGTVRDLLMGEERLFWISDSLYLLIIIVIALIVRLTDVNINTAGIAFDCADSFALAVFTAVGVLKVTEAGGAVHLAVMMGVLTGVGGGLMRDVLLGKCPVAFEQPFYTSASAAGALASAIVYQLTADSWLSVVVCVGLVSLLRVFSIAWECRCVASEKVSVGSVRQARVR